jgi:hypothetical protein
MPDTHKPVCPEQLSANRANAAKSTGPKTPERMALSQQAILRAARLESGLFTTCLNEGTRRRWRYRNHPHPEP